MTSYLNTINSKSGSILYLNNENPQQVNIGNGLVVDGSTTFNGGLSVNQRIGQEGYTYNSQTAGTLTTKADLRVINKRIQPSKESIIQKISDYVLTTKIFISTDIVWSEYHKLFLSVRAGNSPYVSIDGINWSNPISFTITMADSIACWSPELRVFVVTDGITNRPFQVNTGNPSVTPWVRRPTTPLTLVLIITSLVWSPELGIFLATGVNSLFRSSDGQSWVEQSVAFTFSTVKNSTIWCSELGIFLASASDGAYIYYSSDGITWNPSSNAFYPDSIIQWSPKLYSFIACGNGNEYSTSVDGITWVSRGTNLENLFINWINELELFIGGNSTNGIIYSNDGINWYSVIGAMTYATGICWSKEKSILLYYGNTDILISGPILPDIYSSLLVDDNIVNFDYLTGTSSFSKGVILASSSGNVGINITNPTYKLDVNGTSRFSNVSYFSQTVSTTSSTTGSVRLEGGLGINNSTDAVSITNGGSITTAGGVAIAKKLFVGTDATIGTSTTGTLTLPNTTLAGTVLTVSNTTDSTSSTTGSVRLAGGLGINDSADATSVTNGGSITTAGGVAIAKKLFVGTDATIGTSTTGTLTLPNTTLSGTVLTVSNTTDSTSSTTGSVTLAGGLGINDSVDAISTTNGGSITTAGGVAIAKKLFVGTDVTIGTTTTGTLTLPNTSLAGTVLIVSNTTDSTSSTTGSVTLAGGLGINDSADATSITNGGSITTAGGVAIAKKLFVGTDVTIGTTTTGTLTLPNTSLAGTVLTISNTTASTSSTTGSVVLAGGLGIGGVIYAGGGEINLTNGTSNKLYFNINGITAPGNGISGPAGQKIVLYPGTTILPPYGFGINTSELWYNTSQATDVHRFYTGNTTRMTISNTSVALTQTTDSTSSTTGALTLEGGLGINDSLDATSITNGGSITTAGGVAIAKRLYVGTNAFINTSATIGSTATAVRTLDVETHLRIKGTSAVLDIGTGTDVQIYRSSNGMRFVTNSIDRIIIDSTGIVSVTSTTASTSNTTGALTVAGGLGVAGSIFTPAVTSDRLVLSGTQSLGDRTITSNVNYGLIFSADPKTIGTFLFTNANATDTYIIMRSGQFLLENTTSNVISFLAAGSSAPGNGVYGPVGQKISLLPGTVSTPPYGFGINTNELWYNTTTATDVHRFYTGSVSRMTISNTSVALTQTTASMSSTTGALTVAGGVGIGGVTYVGGGEINLTNTTSNKLIITTVNGLSAPANGASGPAGQKIVLYPGSVSEPPYGFGINTNELWYNTSLAADVHRFYTGNTARMTISNTSVALTQTTASTSNTTGALTVAGGAGVSGYVCAGGLDITNNGSSLGNWSYIGNNVNGTNITGTRPGFGFAWNQTAAHGESIMTYYTGGGSQPRFDLCTWNGTTRTVVTSWQSTGHIFHYSGQFQMLNSTSNLIYFNSNGLSAPANGTTGPAGQKLVLFPGDGTQPPYGFGVNNAEMWRTVFSGAVHRWYIGTTTQMTLSGTGLNIVGALSKGSGTFDIKHPIVKNKRLVHSFIEGPRCDLIYRGTVKLMNGKADVNIDRQSTNSIECAMTEGTFVALCKNPVKYLHNNSSFSRVIGKISGNILTIICEDPDSTDTIDWMVIAERKDTFIKNWERTNANGELITEY